MPADRLWTDAEHEVAAQAIRDNNDHEAWNATYPLIPAGHFAAAVLAAAAPLIAARATTAERNRIDTALRNLPCPDGERPGARITADEHYRWMTAVLAVVNAITEEDADAAA